MNYEHSEESHKAQSFIYTIHQENAVVSNSPVYEFDIGNLNNSHDEYLVEVKDFVIGTNVDANRSFFMVVAEGLAEDGKFCEGKLKSNECLLSVVPVANATYMGSSGTFFKTKGLRMNKRIKITIKNPDFTDAVSGTDIDTGGNPTRWVLVLQFTPIMNGLVLGGSGMSLTR
jgi:hypothetical protein